jgi:hypothetical protein
LDTDISICGHETVYLNAAAMIAITMAISIGSTKVIANTNTDGVGPFNHHGPIDRILDGSAGFFGAS